jgi:hypothetical protein
MAWRLWRHASPQGAAAAERRLLARVLTPIAKFWVCKRGVELTGEAMEVLGGNGYVDTGVMARLFREAPVNSIWEGSGNVMCLDVLRAISREPDGAQLLLQDLIDTAAGEPALLQQAQSLARRLSGPPDQLEAQARRLVQDLVLLVWGPVDIPGPRAPGLRHGVEILFLLQRVSEQLTELRVNGIGVIVTEKSKTGVDLLLEQFPVHP